MGRPRIAWGDEAARGAAGECPGYGHGAAAGPSARWQDEYRHWRPPVERGIAWRTRHSCRLRYRGVLKNGAWLHTRTAALNLRRMVNLGLDVTDGAWMINPATAWAAGPPNLGPHRPTRSSENSQRARFVP
nr:transposase [Streptomyces sp. SID7805]